MLTPPSPTAGRPSRPAGPFGRRLGLVAPVGRGAAPVDPRRDGAFTTAQDVGDLRVGESLVVVEDECGALAVGQHRERVEHLVGTEGDHLGDLPHGVGESGDHLLELVVGCRERGREQGLIAGIAVAGRLRGERDQVALECRVVDPGCDGVDEAPLKGAAPDGRDRVLRVGIEVEAQPAAAFAASELFSVEPRGRVGPLRG